VISGGEATLGDSRVTAFTATPNVLLERILI